MNITATFFQNKHKFDAQKLKEWGFENKKLPIHSYVINQHIPFFQVYQTEVQYILLVFFILTAALFISLYYYYRTKILKNDLEKTTICKLTIQRMGGDIWIDKSYKNGAKFVFSHPIKKA